MPLLRQYKVEYLTITFPLIKRTGDHLVIMIGEYAKPGRRCEYKALLDAAVWKAFIFGLLVFAVCVERISARHGRRRIQHIGVWVETRHGLTVTRNSPGTPLKGSV